MALKASSGAGLEMACLFRASICNLREILVIFAQLFCILPSFRAINLVFAQLFRFARNFYPFAQLFSLSPNDNRQATECGPACLPPPEAHSYSLRQPGERMY